MTDIGGSVSNPDGGGEEERMATSRETIQALIVIVLVVQRWPPNQARGSMSQHAKRLYRDDRRALVDAWGVLHRAGWDRWRLGEVLGWRGDALRGFSARISEHYRYVRQKRSREGVR